MDASRFDLLKTPRLLAARARDDDFGTLVRLHEDPEVMATLGGVPPDGARRTREFLDRMLEHWDLHGYGLYMLRTPTGAFVGRVGLRHVYVGGCAELEIMYALARAHWNQGYATEAAVRLRDLALVELRQPSVVAFTLPTNFASRRVMEKTGLHYEADIVWHDRVHVLYRQRRPES